MSIHTDFATVPLGLFVCRLSHEDFVSLHLQLKTTDEAWSDQPALPVFHEHASRDQRVKVWDWAKKNLPIYEYPNPVKVASA